MGCTGKDMELLIPVEDLTDAIFGKANSSTTIEAKRQPKECEVAKIQKSWMLLTNCYSSLGFEFNVGKCFASALLNETKCYHACGDSKFYNAVGWSNFVCQQCIAVLRMDRRKCTYKTLGINTGCSKCQFKAREYWDNNCMMQCMGSVETATKHCRECYD